MTTQHALRHIVIALAALVAVPATTAKAAPPNANARKAGASFKLRSGSLQHDKEVAAQLTSAIESSRDFKRLRRSLSGQQRAAAAVHVRLLSRFYAVPAKKRAQVWNQLLDELVRRKKITAKDKRALRSILVHPHKTLRTWKPTTSFGRAVLEQATGATGGANPPPVTANSTAGNAGAVIGGIIGAIGGGTPVSVGIGAAIGKLVGEGANAAGVFNSGGTPPAQTQSSGAGTGEGGREEGGGEDGGDEGGNGGEDGGGDDGGGD